MNFPTFLQNLTLNFTAIESESISCNKKFVSIMDEQGKAHIFDVFTFNPDDFRPITLPFPTWAIVAIVIGSLLIIVIIACVIIKKRKQKLGSYKKFTN